MQEKIVYILIPVHNRREVTVHCLEHLQQQGILDQYQVVVIDDGSTDGTADAIARDYSQVRILQGSGDLWWTGAIVQGMKYATSQDAEYIIWLNDDTLPNDGAIEMLVAACQKNIKVIASAQCYEDNSLTHPTYGAQIKKILDIKLKPTQRNQIQTCDALSGNLICFSSDLIRSIGYPAADRVPHCQADIVYTYQGKKAGFIPTVLGDSIAICAMNPMDSGWINSSVAIRERWKIMNSPKSNLYPSAYWYYCWKFYGFLGIFPFIQVYLRLAIVTVLSLVFPIIWLQRLKAFKDRWL